MNKAHGKMPMGKPGRGTVRGLKMPAEKVKDFSGLFSGSPQHGFQHRKPEDHG